MYAIATMANAAHPFLGDHSPQTPTKTANSAHWMPNHSLITQAPG
jgi:hypothetical protein